MSRASLLQPIHSPRCQFYHLGWINCEPDSSKKIQRFKRLKKKKRISGVPRPWHCQAQLITTDMIGRLILGTGETERETTAHSLALSTSLLFLLNNKVPIESMTEPETLNTDELHPSPQQTAADRRSCTSELYKPHKPRVQCCSVWAGPTYLAIQSMQQ